MARINFEPHYAARVMPKENNAQFHGVRVNRVLIPVTIGLGVVAYMMIREFNPDAFAHFQLRDQSYLWIALSILAMLMRDFGYIVRLRILSGKALNWIQSFRVVMLWEFTSTITPSAVGGTSIAILYVNKEGISIGKSSAIVMATSFLDELYFILMFPLLLLVIDIEQLFGLDMSTESIWSNEFFFFAVIGYSLKLLYLLALSYGLFINPKGLKWLLMQIFRLPFLKRWRKGADKAGNDIIDSSKELIKKPFSFWLKSFGATFFSWTSRYWVVNAMLLSFFALSGHFVIFARQLVMWIMMLVSPTPGGSGFAEFVFTRYLGDFIPVSAEALAMVAIAMAFLWRLISYYPYMIIGAIVFPRWIKNHFLKKPLGKRE